MILKQQRHSPASVGSPKIGLQMEMTMDLNKDSQHTELQTLTKKTELLLDQVRMIERSSDLLVQTTDNLQTVLGKIEKIVTSQTNFDVRLIEQFTKQLYSIFEYMAQMKDRVEELHKQNFAPLQDQKKQEPFNIWDSTP